MGMSDSILPDLSLHGKGKSSKSMRSQSTISLASNVNHNSLRQLHAANRNNAIQDVSHSASSSYLALNHLFHSPNDPGKSITPISSKQSMMELAKQSSATRSSPLPEEPFYSFDIPPLTFSLSPFTIYLLLYAEWLHRICASEKCAELLKFTRHIITIINSVAEPSVANFPTEAMDNVLWSIVSGFFGHELEIPLTIICSNCSCAFLSTSAKNRSTSNSPVSHMPSGQRCPRCHLSAIHCVICSLPIQNYMATCPTCGHGGELRYSFRFLTHIL